MSELLHILYETEVACNPDGERDVIESLPDIALADLHRRLGDRALELIRLISLVQETQDRRLTHHEHATRRSISYHG